MNKSFVSTAIMALTLATITGCATTGSDAPGAKKTGTSKLVAERAADKITNVQRQFYKKSDDIHVTGKVFRIAEQKELPFSFQKRYTIATDGPMAYFEIGNLISRVSGVPVEVAPEAFNFFKALPSASRHSGFADKEYWVEFAKHGTLEEILDYYASKGQLSWKYENGRVKLHKYETRIFTVNAIAGSETFSSSMATSVSQNTEGGKTSSKIESAVAGQIPEIWDSVMKAVGTMTSAAGKVAANRQTGTITITDEPSVLDKIQDYVDQENERLNTTIMYRVDIIEINSKSGDDYGVSLTDLIYQGSDGAFTLASGSSSLSEVASTLTGSVIRPSSKFEGSQALIQAVSTNVDVVSHRTAFTSEVIGLVARVQEVREQGYLAERSVNSINANAGIEITQRVETTTEGFAVSMLGMPSASGGLILQTLVDLSNIEDIERRGTEDNFIESPLRLVRNAKSKTRMQPGDTVIAAMMEHSYKERNQRGVGHPMNWLFGGQSRSANNQNYTLVLVTPYYKEL